MISLSSYINLSINKEQDPDKTITVPVKCFGIFNSIRKPSIPLEEFVNRVAFHSECSEACLIYSIIYIDKLISKGLAITEVNQHRLALVAMMVAAKYLDDEFFNNRAYSIIGGISNEELNKMEIQFLIGLDFKLAVHIEIYESWVRLIYAMSQ
jgi:hypothetical protein